MKYIVYCDESSHTNISRRKYLTIGSLWLPRERKLDISRSLKVIRRENNLGGEIKWQKVSAQCLPAYKSIVDYFFSLEDMRFRVIAVDQTKVEYSKYHESDMELGFYKFYYQLLYQWMEPGNEYLFLLDFKSNRGANRFTTLKNALVNKMSDESTVSDLTIIDSEQSHILQLCDLLTGAVAAAFNRDLRPGSPKKDLEQHIAGRLGWSDLTCSTAKDFRKFNIFKIDLDINA